MKQSQPHKKSVSATKTARSSSAATKGRSTQSSMNSAGKGMLIGAGVVAIAAAAAGTYFLYGSRTAQKNRKQVRGWMLRARGEVLEKMENLKDINEETYHKIVKEVSDRYKKLKKVNPAEVIDFVSELKDHWVNIKKEIDSISR